MKTIIPSKELINNHAIRCYDNGGHPEGDYIRDGYLRPEAVRVRLTRTAHRTYAVEISPRDRDYTFQEDVAEAVSRHTGGEVILGGRGGNGISVRSRKGYRAGTEFQKIEDMPR